ncbi:MAG: hypothetical protein ACREFW_06650 [Rhizomicrobium sp.]
MTILSRPSEANTRLGHLIVEGLTGSLIALSALLALAAVTLSA